MARITPPDRSALPADAQAVLEKHSPIFGWPTWPAIMAHCPTQMLHVIALMESFGKSSTVPARYIEIAVVTASRINECRHCVDRHSIRLAESGLSAAAIEKILDPDCPELDETDRLVRDFAIQVSERSQYLRDAMFENMRNTFSEPQIVELVLRIALAGFFNRFNNTFQVENGEKVVASLAARGLSSSNFRNQ